VGGIRVSIVDIKIVKENKCNYYLFVSVCNSTSIVFISLLFLKR
jgi:hypothetical protein